MLPKVLSRDSFRPWYFAREVGEGEKLPKKKWLLKAMLAWLKRAAVAGLRAYCRTNCLGCAFSASKPVDGC